MQQVGKSGPRTRTGCLTCRRRRVKCDEGKPSCTRCLTANLVCDGYREKRRVVSPRSASPAQTSNGQSTQTLGSHSMPATAQQFLGFPYDSVPTTLSVFPHSSYRADHLCSYHQFVTSTVVQLFRKDQLPFWRGRVARMSWDVDVVYEAIRAIGAIHLSHRIPSSAIMQAEAKRLTIIGLDAYDNAIHLLAMKLKENQQGCEETIIVALILLNIFECCMGNARLAFQHLWAAVQMLKASPTPAKAPHLLPLREIMVRLDFVAQNIVPYSRSSFFRAFTFQPPLMETPFYSSSAFDIEGLGSVLGPDKLTNERLSLWRLIAAHNHMDKIVWSSFYGADEQPGRDQLLSFRAELLLWRQNAPETFTGYNDTLPQPIDTLPAEYITPALLQNLSIPPEPLLLPTRVTAITIAYYNLYLACTLSMLSNTNPLHSPQDRTALEFEAYTLTYDNLRLAAGILETPHSWVEDESPAHLGATFCTKLDPSISFPLFLGGRRCFDDSWVEWSIAAMREVGRAGLVDGGALANCLELVGKVDGDRSDKSVVGPIETLSPLGPLSERTIPLLMPNFRDDEMAEAFYLRYGSGSAGVIAKARWRKMPEGRIEGLQVQRFDGGRNGDGLRQAIGSGEERGQNDPLMEWKRSLEAGWHTFVHAGNGVDTSV